MTKAELQRAFDMSRDVLLRHFARRRETWERSERGELSVEQAKERLAGATSELIGSLTFWLRIELDEKGQPIEDVKR